MPSAGFEPVTPATKRPQTYALDRAATEVGPFILKASIHERTGKKFLNVLNGCGISPAAYSLCIRTLHDGGSE
jgi:hypothetical protein